MDNASTPSSPTADLQSGQVLNRFSGNAYSNPFLVRFFAHFFSILFHPLFISCYVLYFLIFIHPLAFAGMEDRKKLFLMISVFFTSAFLPSFATFLMWRLRLGVQSLQLRTQKERIIPYVAAMIFYFWVWRVFNNLPDIPAASIHFLLGAFVSVCAAFFCNIYFKISMHATAVGGLAMFFLLFSYADGYSSGLYLSLAFLITGIVCTSRLIVAGHSAAEIYFGLFIGALVQWIAWQF